MTFKNNPFKTEKDAKCLVISAQLVFPAISSTAEKNTSLFLIAAV